MLSPYDIKNSFDSAKKDVAIFIPKYGINCSLNVDFVGFDYNKINPIKMWYNREKKKFYITFSVYYIKNRFDKVKNLFIRYIITTNVDGSFKDFQTALNEVKKIEEIFLDYTFVANYLATKCEQHPNAFCHSCKRMYELDVNSNMYKNIQEYVCTCGGELSRIADYKPSEFTLINYKFGEYKVNSKKINVAFYTKEFFSTIPHTEEDYNAFISYISNYNKMTKKFFIPHLKELIADKKVNVLKMFHFAFSAVFNSCYKDLRKAEKEYLDSIFEMPFARAKKQIAHEQLEINREDFPCTDEEFSMITNYIRTKSPRSLRGLLVNAFDQNNSNYIISIVKADYQGCKNILHYLKQKDRNKLSIALRKVEQENAVKVQ